jgi:hypothetical protein
MARKKECGSENRIYYLYVCIIIYTYVKMEVKLTA